MKDTGKVKLWYVSVPIASQLRFLYNNVLGTDSGFHYRVEGFVVC